MTQEDFNQMMNNYLADLAKQNADSWAVDALDWAVAQGILKGGSNGELMPKKFITRQEVVTLLQRLIKNEQ